MLIYHDCDANEELYDTNYNFPVYFESWNDDECVLDGHDATVKIFTRSLKTSNSWTNCLGLLTHIDKDGQGSKRTINKQIRNFKVEEINQRRCVNQQARKPPKEIRGDDTYTAVPVWHNKITGVSHNFQTVNSHNIFKTSLITCQPSTVYNIKNKFSAPRHLTG